MQRSLSQGRNILRTRSAQRATIQTVQVSKVAMSHVPEVSMEIAERMLNYFDISVSTRRHITLQFFIKSGEPSVPTNLHYWPYL